MDTKNSYGSAKYTRTVKLPLSLCPGFFSYRQATHTTTEEKHQVCVDGNLYEGARQDHQHSNHRTGTDTS
jgi:hypothetical protein